MEIDESSSNESDMGLDSSDNQSTTDGQQSQLRSSTSFLISDILNAATAGGAGQSSSAVKNSGSNHVSKDTNNNKGKKLRKARTAFSDQQLSELEKNFDRQKYLSVQDRIDLASRLHLSDTQVKTWYQNRRTKWKRQTAVGLELLAEASNIAALQRLIQNNAYWQTHPLAQALLANPSYGNGGRRQGHRGLGQTTPSGPSASSSVSSAESPQLLHQPQPQPQLQRQPRPQPQPQLSLPTSAQFTRLPTLQPISPPDATGAAIGVGPLTGADPDPSTITTSFTAALSNMLLTAPPDLQQNAALTAMLMNAFRCSGNSSNGNGRLHTMNFLRNDSHGAGNISQT